MTTKKHKGRWMPPRGIRYRNFPERSVPYYLIWTDPETGKEKTEKYDSEASRELAAKALAEKRANAGSTVLEFDPEKWRQWLAFQKLVGANVDPLIVAREWLETKQGKPIAVSMTVKEVYGKYFTLRNEEKNWGPAAASHAKTRLDRFTTVFGARPIHDVSTDDVREWLRTVKDKNGKALGLSAIRDHRKDVSTFFEYALRERWGARENPCARIVPVKDVEGDPVVIPLCDAFNFFKANRDERLIGRLALEAFGFVRYTTAGKIQKQALNFEKCGIRMAAVIHKTGQIDGKSRYRQGHPGNLWAWLKHAPETCWEMTLLNYREAKRYAAIRAGIRPIENETEVDQSKLDGLRNIWRHSCISYHLARYKKVHLTQYLAQHSNSKTTEKYEGMADETDAARYWMITPETVKLSWDEFIALPIKPLDEAEKSIG